MEQENRMIICTRCPRGCEVKVLLDGNSISEMDGNICKLGKKYVELEIKAPQRIVTSTVKVKNGKYPLAPIWTEDPIPKGQIFSLMKLLKDIELEAPVDINQVVIKDLFGLGINVVTSGAVPLEESIS